MSISPRMHFSRSRIAHRWDWRPALAAGLLALTLTGCDRSNASPEDTSDADPPATQASDPQPNDAGFDLGRLTLPDADRITRLIPPIDLDRIRRDPKELVRLAFEKGQAGSYHLDTLVQAQFPLSRTRQVSLGRDVYLSRKQSGTLIQDPAQQARLERLARPIIRKDVSQADDLDFTLSVVKDARPNAFAHVGGYLYATTGLLKLLNDDELAFVLGHEVGHVELGHVNRPWVYLDLAQEFGGEKAANYTGIAYSKIANGFSEDQEFEADDWGFLAARRQGHPFNAAISSHQKMADWYRDFASVPPPAEPPTNLKDAVQAAMRDHARTHPPSEERIARLKLLEQRVND